MRLNADFSHFACVTPEQYRWVASPSAGVERMMLDRIGDEVARATSLVRYAPNSQFSRHTHGGGEEIYVLSGTFSDEHGDYPAGTYLRNPPGSSHTPFSAGGCTILVKLWQFAYNDLEQLTINTQQSQWLPGQAEGLSVLPLHEHNGVSTALVKWAPHTRFGGHVHPGGEEILVLEGVFNDEHGSYPAGSWIRNPRYSHHTPFTGEEGALIYVKVGYMGANLLGDKFITDS